MAIKEIAAGVTGGAAVVAAAYFIGLANGGPEGVSGACGKRVTIESTKKNDMADLVGRAATAAGVEVDTDTYAEQAALDYKIDSKLDKPDPDNLPTAVQMQICYVTDPADPAEERTAVSYQLFLNEPTARPQPRPAAS